MCFGKNVFILFLQLCPNMTVTLRTVTSALGQMTALPILHSL